jgi:hypothetical protein
MNDQPLPQDGLPTRRAGADIDGVAATERRRGRRRPEPLNVRFEVVVIDGEEGKELHRRQAAVVREALAWFANNPATTPSG